MALRHRVFVKEQGVPPDLERDEQDEHALHVVALEGKRVVATGRLAIGPTGRGRIGRMAVDPAMRRQGLAGQVLTRLEDGARELGITKVMVHAQVYVEGFYARRGYVAEGETFLEAKIRHVAMFKKF